MRKFDGGTSWLFELTAVLNVGLNAPAAAATRVSLICGSSRSALRSTLCSSAIFTASSAVSRSVAVAAEDWIAEVCADADAKRAVEQRAARKAFRMSPIFD